MPEEILKKLDCQKLFPYKHIQAFIILKMLVGVNFLS